MPVFSFPENKKAYFLTIYVIITSVTIYFHECWRDEWQAILVSVNSNSFSELFAFLRLEQHPPLWYLLIKIVWLAYPHLASIKILHLFIAFTSGYIILYKIKYPLNYRISFLFSYFLLYEYTIICRNYGLVVLFGLLAIYELQKENKNYWILFCFLTAMALTHVYGLFLSFSLCLYCFFICYNQYKQPAFFFPVLLYGALSLAICLLLRPQHHPIVAESEIDPLRALRTIFAGLVYMWNSFIPIPEFKTAFWNTNFMNGLFPRKLFPMGSEANLIKIIIFIPFLFFLLKPLYKLPKLIIPLLTGWLLFILLQGFVYAGFMRHWGFYFICFMFFAFLYGKQIPLLKYFLWGSIGCGIFAIAMEIRYPFTEAENVANYIKEEPSSKVVMTNECTMISSVSAYLGKPIYYSGTGTMNTFTNWINYYELKGAEIISPEASLDSLKKRMMKEHTHEGFLVISTTIDKNQEFVKHIKHDTSIYIKEFSSSISEEDFWVIGLNKNH